MAVRRPAASAWSFIGAGNIQASARPTRRPTSITLAWKSVFSGRLCQMDHTFTFRILQASQALRSLVFKSIDEQIAGMTTPQTVRSCLLGSRQSVHPDSRFNYEPEECRNPRPGNNPGTLKAEALEISGKRSGSQVRESGGHASGLLSGSNLQGSSV